MIMTVCSCYYNYFDLLLFSLCVILLCVTLKMHMNACCRYDVYSYIFVDMYYVYTTARLSLYDSLPYTMDTAIAILL